LRCRPALVCRILCLCVAAAALPAQATEREPATQPQASLGILLTAPEFGRGIDELPLNLLAYWVATYSVAPSAGVPTRVRIYYLEEPIDAADDWTDSGCQERRVVTSPGGLFYFQSPSGWAILIGPDPDGSPDGSADSLDPPCEFIDRFVARFQFFQSLESSGPAPAFPAILESSN
jgi:hypothetical protein